MNYIYLLLFTEIVLLYFAYISCGRDIMSPSVVMIGVFILSTFFAVFNVENWHIDYSYKAYILLTTGLLTFLVVESFFYVVSSVLRKRYINSNQYHGFFNEEHKIIEVQTWKLLFLLIYCVLCIYLQYCEEMRIAIEAGFNGSGNFITYYRNAAIIDGTSAGQQINGLLRQFLKLVTISGYIALFIYVNNVFIYKDKQKRNVLYLLIALIACIRAFLAASRLDILKYIIFVFVVGYILLKRKSKWHWNINMKLVKYMILILLMLIPVFYFASSAIGRTTQKGKSLFEYISIYAGGSINAFDLYIKTLPAKSEGWGEECFAGLQSFLWRWGLTESSSRTSPILEFVNTEYFRTNVYTFFRRPLHDFGAAGMYIFTAIVSTLFACFYHFKMKEKSKKKRINTDVATMIYGYLFIWIACSFMEQYSFTILTPSLAFIFIMFYVIYWFLITKFTWK